MNLKTTFILTLLLLTGLAVFSGCTATTGPTPQTTVMTPEPVTPLTPATLITALPVDEVARIQVDHFGLDPSNGDVYEFTGKVQVNDGVYHSVQVILRYPDGQEYTYNAGGMGGSNVTLKPFFIYPDNRYMGTNPDKIIALDGKRYHTIYRYEDGVLVWIATSDTVVTP
jgi:hypothetical protein